VREKEREKEWEKGGEKEGEKGGEIGGEKGGRKERRKKEIKKGRTEGRKDFISISHLQVTGGVEEQVARLQVAVQHVGRVDVLETAQDLVQKVAHVVVGQLLRLQQFVQVRVHQTLDYVAEN